MNKPTQLLILILTSICLLTTTAQATTLTTQPTTLLPPTLNGLPITTAKNLTITQPRCSAPVILEAGHTFTIHFTADSFTTAYAYLSTAYEPIVDNYWLTLQPATGANHTWTTTATIPAAANPELYNLTLLLDNNGILLTRTQPRAVSITHITDTFTFIHITDLHVGDPRGFLTNVRQTLHYRSIIRTITEVNLLHPDFVLITGDLVFGQLYPGEYAKEYPILYNLLQRFDVPTYLVPGNHDCYKRLPEDGQTLYQQYFGAMNYSFDYGNYHFIGINSYDLPARQRLAIGPVMAYWGGAVSDQQLAWINHDLNTSKNKTLTFMFLHHSPLLDSYNDSLTHKRTYTNRQPLLNLIDADNVSMVLAGHVHWDSAYTVNGTIFLTTTTPESNVLKADGYWGYRMISIVNGTIASYNYKDPYYSIPSYHLQANIAKNQRKGTATSTLEKNMTVLLRFLLPDGTYVINTGSILEERSDGTTLELYVLLPVPANSTATVTVKNHLETQ